MEGRAPARPFRLARGTLVTSRPAARRRPPRAARAYGTAVGTTVGRAVAVGPGPLQSPQSCTWQRLFLFEKTTRSEQFRSTAMAWQSSKRATSWMVWLQEEPSPHAPSVASTTASAAAPSHPRCASIPRMIVTPLLSAHPDRRPPPRPPSRRCHPGRPAAITTGLRAASTVARRSLGQRTIRRRTRGDRPCGTSGGAPTGHGASFLPAGGALALDASAARSLVRGLPRSVNDAFEPLSARRRTLRIGCHAGGIT